MLYTVKIKRKNNKNKIKNDSIKTEKKGSWICNKEKINSRIKKIYDNWEYPNKIKDDLKNKQLVSLLPSDQKNNC